MNIANILKDVPRGTKLYSPICGEVTFNCVCDYIDFPIRCIKGNDEHLFTEEGKYFKDYPDAECMIFPSNSKSWKNWKDKLLYKTGNIVKDLLGTLYLVDFYDKESVYTKTYYNERVYFRKNKQLTWASESEIQKFHQKLKENGYKWDGKNIVKIDRYEALVEKLDEKCPCWRECIKED